MTEDDFAGEFNDVKQLTEEEVKSDSLIKRLKLERRIRDLEEGKLKESQEVTDFHASGEESKKRKDDEKPKENEEKLRKSKRIKLTGKEEFLKMIEIKKQHKKERRMKKGQEPENSKPKIVDTEEKDQTESAEVAEPDQKESAETAEAARALDVEIVKNAVLAQLSGKMDNFPNLLQSSFLLEKYNEVYKMLEHTVKDREGHSALLVGPRASGKSAIIQRALKEIGKNYPDQFLKISLSAYLHSDDNIAVREIARQLDYNSKKIDEELQNEESAQSKFEQRGISDTFSNVLAILDDASNKTASENKQSAAIIFVIDEFEKYTGNSKQALLYNLFDLSQTSSVPICVVGISTRISTRELLEKRVRSRFSQRVIALNRPQSVEEFWNNAKLNLTVNEETAGKFHDTSYAAAWNKSLDDLFANQGSKLKKIVLQNFFSIKNFKEFANHCVFPVSQVTNQHPFIDDDHFRTYATLQPRNNIQDIIDTLSTLELLLVIAAARWVEKVDLPAINFNMVYKEYQEMMQVLNAGNVTLNSASAFDNTILSNIKVNQKIWSPRVLKNSWETLYKLGIVLDVITQSTETNNANNNINKNFIIDDTKMVQLDVTLDELSHLVGNLSVYKRLTML